MKPRIGITALLMLVLTLPVLAADEPVTKAAPAKDAPKQVTPAKTDTAKAAPVKSKAGPVRKRPSAAQTARSNAMLDAAYNDLGMQFMQAEANRRAAVIAEQQRVDYQRAEQLDTIRRLSPRATPVVRVRPDGSYDTSFYYVFPNAFPIVPTQP
jgi:hypothetical protein